jgi:hypothetical protein
MKEFPNVLDFFTVGEPVVLNPDVEKRIIDFMEEKNTEFTRNEVEAYIEGCKIVLD